MVATNMDVFSNETLAANTPCKPGPLVDVAQRIAVVHAEFLLIHPFRDGNGRMARWIADLMAAQAGLPNPDFRFQGRGGPERRASYLMAVKRGYALDHDALRDVFVEAIRRAERSRD